VGITGHAPQVLGEAMRWAPSYMSIIFPIFIIRE
jgi:hypothetical protein